MSAAELRNEINRLSPRDKLQLIETIWNSLSNDELAAVPLSADELDELDRRVARYEEDPATGVALRDLDDYLKTH
jgi:putative addiction module component (TIGR02574 family)